MRILNLRQVAQVVVVIIFMVGIAAYPVTAQDDELSMTYVSPDGSLSFRYPAGWIVDAIGGGTLLIPSMESGFGVVVAIMTSELFTELRLDPTTSTEQIAEQMRSLTETNLAISVEEITEATPVDFNGMDGLAFETRFSQDGHPGHYIYIILKASDGTSLIISLQGNPDSTAQYRETAYAILETLVYTPITIDLANLAPITPENAHELSQLAGSTMITFPDTETLTYSPDGRYIVYGRSTKIQFLEATTLAETHVPLSSLEDRVIGDFAFNLDGTQLVGTAYYLLVDDENRSSIIRLWNVAQGLVPWTIPVSADYITDIIFSPDDQHIARSYEEGQVVILEAATGGEIWQADLVDPVQQRSVNILRLAYSPDGVFLAVCARSDQRPLMILDAATGEINQILEMADDGCSDMDYHPSGNYIVTGGWQDEAKITLWNTADWSIAWEVESADTVNRVLFGPDGSLIAATSGNFLRLYDTETGALLTEIDITQGQPHQFPPFYTGLAFSPNGDTLAVMGSSVDNTLRIFGVRP